MFNVNEKGFTLIELLVALVIIGVLVAIALPSYKFYVARTQASESLKSASLQSFSVAQNLQRGRCTTVAGVNDVYPNRFGTLTISGAKVTSKGENCPSGCTATFQFNDTTEKHLQGKQVVFNILNNQKVSFVSSTVDSVFLSKELKSISTTITDNCTAIPDQPLTSTDGSTPGGSTTNPTPTDPTPTTPPDPTNPTDPTNPIDPTTPISPTKPVDPNDPITGDKVVTEEDAKQAFKYINIVYKYADNGMWTSSTRIGEWLMYATFTNGSTPDHRDPSNWTFASFDRLNMPKGTSQLTVYGKSKAPALLFKGSNLTTEMKCYIEQEGGGFTGVCPFNVIHLFYKGVPAGIVTIQLKINLDNWSGS